MKKLLIALMFTIILIPFHIKAAEGDLVWQKDYALPSLSSPNNVVGASRLSVDLSNIYFGSHKWGALLYEAQTATYFNKINQNSGTLDLSTEITNSNFQVVRTIPDLDGTSVYYVGGSPVPYNSHPYPHCYYIAQKRNISDNSLIWQYILYNYSNFWGTCSDSFSHVAVDTSGLYLEYGGIISGMNTTLLKLSRSSGSVLWSKVLHNVDVSFMGSPGPITVDSSGVYATWSLMGPSGVNYIGKYNINNGAQIWLSQTNDPVFVSDNAVFVNGGTLFESSTKVDSTFTIPTSYWTLRNSSNGSAVTIINDGSHFVAGVGMSATGAYFSYCSTISPTSCFLQKRDLAGALSWVRNDLTFAGSLNVSNGYLFLSGLTAYTATPTTSGTFSIQKRGLHSPDLTASNITPTTAFIGTPTTLSATITSANAPTGASFSNFFQVATAENGGGTITDLPATIMPALASGGTGTATYSHTFTTAGMHYVRVCADKTSSAGGGVIDESAPNELNNCSPTWTPVLVLDPDTIIFNGAGCVLPASGGPCNVTAWWNVVLPGVETVNIKVEGPPGSGYAKVFKNLPVNSSSLAKTLSNTKNLAAVTFPPSPTSVPQSSAFQVPVSVAGQLTLYLLRTFDQSVLKSIPPVVSCSPGQIIVNGVCVTPCANGATTASSCTVCPPTQAFDGTSCMFCIGGCSGAGGVSSNSGATCNNLALNPPLCSLCPPGQDTSSGVCADIVVTPACDNDTTCDPGETILNCPRDCKVKYREF